MTTLKNGILSSTTENYTCWGRLERQSFSTNDSNFNDFRCLGRVSDKENSQGRWVNINEADFRCDIVKSMCNNTSGDDVYQMLHAQIIERTTKKKPPKSVNGSQYSVYVILIDSMSSSQGIRRLLPNYIKNNGLEDTESKSIYQEEKDEKVSHFDSRSQES
uniref:C-type lectin domain-containing protein n=1 Tax=Heterorhabditis bacteriophora TaxID=37862 RepID=A0A1I7XDP5_HETBA